MQKLRKRLFIHLKRIKDAISIGADVFKAAVWFLLKLALLCVLVFIVLSLTKGGEPFHRLSQKADYLFGERYVHDTEEYPGVSGLLGRCRKGIRFASDVLAGKGDKIMEIRLGIVSTKKEREEVGEKNVENLNKIIELHKEVE